MIVWCEPIMKDGKLRIGPGDIKKALNYFKQKTGTEARAIILNLKNERYAGEVSKDLKVEYSGGCLQWEVWLSADDGRAT